MQFWRARCKVFDKQPKGFFSKSSHDTEKYNFWEKMNACNAMRFWQHRRINFQERAIIFCSMSETGSRTYKTKCFSGQFSYGDVICSFDNPGANFFWKKRRFLLVYVQIWIEKVNFLKKTTALKEMSPWTPRKQFRQPGWIFFAKTPKLFRSRSEKK